jgi:hypothetical protein
MERIKKAVDVTHDKLAFEDWDSVWCITGQEGGSKSHLGLHILDYWYSRNTLKPEHIKHIGLDQKGFVNALDNTGKVGCCIYDEAGELTNKRTMSKFNVELTKIYQVIRGRNVFTILILPSIFDLDPYFSKRRIRGLFYVYKRGRCAFWSRTRLQTMLQMNALKYVKKELVVRPTFYDTFPKYNGILLDGYKKLKDDKMKEIIVNLKENLKPKKVGRPKKKKE